jgi:Amt family ammonium transporter
MYAASRVAVNTALGGCAGGLGGLLGVLIKSRAPDIISCLNGILGGLVSITAGALYFEPYISIVVGLVGGFLVFHLSRLLHVSPPAFSSTF